VAYIPIFSFLHILKNSSDSYRVILYVFFAIVATLVNLFVQWFFFNFFDNKYILFLAIIAGTIAGLTVKYFLDKKWIFSFTPSDAYDNARTFFLYSLMGVLTTFIFWVSESIFYFYFSFNGSQYIGAIIGLSVGYYLKYLLDRKFVFRK